MKKYTLEQKILFFGILFHLLAVIFSEGFHRPDEHLGLMRFVGYKLGMLNAEQALGSWEYPAMIRPWLQPALMVFILKPFQLIGIHNPFTYAFILRLMSSLLAIWATFSFYILYKDDFKSSKTFLFLLFMIWWVPFFHARPTAENWSASFLLIALPFIIKRRHFFIAGILLGASFVTRYQMIIPIGALALWCLIIDKMKLKPFLLVSLGFLTLNALSTVIDFWGYGVWTFTPWNYWYHNIIESRAASFGVAPFWYYVEKVILRGIPPLSLFLFAGTLLFWWRNRKSAITWMTLSFFIGHSLIGHKEVRFLFPLSVFAAYFIAYLFESNWREKIPRVLIKLTLYINVALIFWSTLRPAHDPIRFYKYIYNKHPEITEITTLNVVRDQLHFYQRHPIQLHYSEVIPTSLPEWILTDRWSQALELDKLNCKPEFSSYPKWLYQWGGRLVQKSKSWILYRCGSRT